MRHFYLRLKQFLKSIWSHLSKNSGIAIVVSLIWAVSFGLSQMEQLDEIERRRIAIEAVDRIRSSEFLKAYKNLMDFPSTNNKPTLKDDLLLVMNVYDHIALLYLNGVADQCLIKKSIKKSMHEISEPIRKVQDSHRVLYPIEFRKNFNDVLHHMERIECRVKQA